MRVPVLVFTKRRAPISTVRVCYATIHYTNFGTFAPPPFSLPADDSEFQGHTARPPNREEFVTCSARTRCRIRLSTAIRHVHGCFFFGWSFEIFQIITCVRAHTCARKRVFCLWALRLYCRLNVYEPYRVNNARVK